MQRLIALLASGLMLVGQNALAAVSDEEFAQLKADFAQLADRFERLASENAELRTVNQQNAQALVTVQEDIDTVQSTESWADRISFKGDFRYRYQNDEVDINSVERNRNRIRARPALTAKLSDSLKVGFGLATGSDDPVSSNQTLGNAGSSKGVVIDLAYFDWMAWEGVNVIGGKFKNPLEVVAKSQLQWDGDWRPEGFGVDWDNGTFFASALGNYLEADSSKDDEFAYILQAGARAELAGISLSGGIGYSDIDAKGRFCYFEPADFGGAFATNGCAGNSVITAPGPQQGVYLVDYQVINLFAQAGLEIGELPLSFWVDYIKNDDADDLDTGYQLGAQLGSAKKQGSWQVKYYYQDLEADATLGLLTNSDFGGGGTDGKGSFISGGYALTDRTNVQLSYFLVEKQDSLGIINGGNSYDFDTFQLDFNFKYE